MVNMTDDITPPEENAIIPAKKTRRRVQLNTAQREELVRQRQIEQAVSYFLDLEQTRTVKQIAEEMGLSVSALKRLTNDPQFQEVYDQTMIQLGHHPRLQA